MAKHKSKDLRVKTNDELKEQIKLLRKEQFNLRFQVSNGQNENPARFKQIRKEIACIKTILNNVVLTKGWGLNYMPKRILTGKVTSNKSDKTITVLVERKIMHPMYKKFVTKSKKFSVHDSENKFNIGDIVNIKECNPISKNKRFEVIY